MELGTHFPTVRGGTPEKMTDTAVLVELVKGLRFAVEALQITAQHKHVRRNRLDVKGVRHVEKFGKKEGEWRVWATVFRSAAQAGHSKAEEWMTQVETQQPPPISTMAEEVRDCDSVLHRVLLQHLIGEALTLAMSELSVRILWWALSDRFNSKTFAGRIRSAHAATHPRKVKHVGELSRAIAAWGLAKTNAKKEYNEAVSTIAEVALLSGMLPDKLYDLVAQQTGVSTAYVVARDRLKAIANTRIEGAQGPGRRNCEWWRRLGRD